MSNPKMYQDYYQAKEAAEKSGEELWDTHTLPERYMVGTPTVEIEEDENNQEWEQLDKNQD